METPDNVRDIWLEACVFNCGMQCNHLWSEFIEGYMQIKKYIELTEEEKNAAMEALYQSTLVALAKTWVDYKKTYDSRNRVPPNIQRSIMDNAFSDVTFVV